MSEDPAPSDREAGSVLPRHVEDSVRTMADLHAEHYGRLTALQKTLDAMTGAAGRPAFVVGVVCLIAAWIGGNLLLAATHLHPIDPPPFSYLQSVASILALVMTCLILTTQRREDQLSTRREQLTLELSLLAEQKAAKVIQLLEELRRDTPQVADRPDIEAAELSTPADPRQVLAAIRDSHEPFEMAAAADPKV